MKKKIKNILFLLIKKLYTTKIIFFLNIFQFFLSHITVKLTITSTLSSF
jgi:hypothetical protein